MMRFIESPNLPSSRVQAVVCGQLCDELNAYLDKLEIERIVIATNKEIDPATEGHADMAAIHIGGNNIIADKNQRELINKLRSRGFAVKESANEVKGEYPYDVSLNFTLIDDKIIGNLSFADSILVDSTSTFKSLNVKQGYCKCSCLVVDKNSIITDDNSVYKIAVRNGLDCLLISKGDISLPGHEYGFIGGASAKISESEVLFFGDITKHRDYKKIAGFINEHGCKIKYLDFPLTDFGGIIPITEKAP